MRDEQQDYVSPSQFDFVPRERRNQSFKLIIAFVLLMAMVFITSYAPSLRNMLYGPLISIIALACLCFYVVLNYQRALDLVMHTEYQNLLYSQGLALGSTFCIFTKRDGTVAYASDGLRDVFGPGDYSQSTALDAVLARGNVSTGDRERVMGAIYNNVADRVVFTLPLANGAQKQFILTMEPFARPSGYMLIRGREYRGERVGMQVMPQLLRSTSIDKLDHMLGNTPIAHYAIDAFGRFEYVNQAFEACLGFDSGEVIEQRLNLKAVLHEVGGHAVSGDYTPVDYAGDAVVQSKSRQFIDCLLFQTAIRDERGRVSGATGTIVVATTLK